MNYSCLAEIGIHLWKRGLCRATKIKTGLTAKSHTLKKASGAHCSLHWMSSHGDTEEKKSLIIYAFDRQIAASHSRNRGVGSKGYFFKWCLFIEQPPLLADIQTCSTNQLLGN